MFTSTDFRSKFVETYYLKFVKLEVARILGYIYTCAPLVPVIKYQYSCTLYPKFSKIFFIYCMRTQLYAEVRVTKVTTRNLNTRTQ